MKALFADTSAFLAVLFEEPGHAEVAGLFRETERVFASGLLEAETRGAAARKGLPTEEVDKALSRLSFFQPDRPLSQELRSLVSAGVPLRGADLWHLACALYLAGNPSALPFLTLDQAQAQAAARLGFRVLPAGLKDGEAHEIRAVYGTKKSGKNLSPRIPFDSLPPSLKLRGTGRSLRVAGAENKENKGRRAKTKAV